MDKGKRSDLLAAGRKKLRQFRQKKDQKDGSKDAKSSSKGSKMDKDVETDELTKISEPEPASLMSTDVLIAHSLDPSTAFQHVDLSAVDSVGVVDGRVQEDGKDPEQVPIALPVDGEGPSSAFEISHEEARPPGPEQCNGESSAVGISRVDNRMDEAAGSILMAMDTERAKEEAHTMEPSSGLEVAQDVVGLSSLACERDKGEGSPITLSENSETRLLGIEDGKEDHDMERSETDLAASENLEVESPQHAFGFSVPSEAIQEVDTNIYHEHEDMLAQDSSDKIISLEEGLEMSSPGQVTSSKSTLSEEKLEMPPPYHVVPDRSASHGEMLDVLSSHRVTYDNSVSTEQNLEVDSSNNDTSGKSMLLEENSDMSSSNQITSNNSASLSENFEIPYLLAIDSHHKKEEDSAMADGKSQVTTMKESSVHETIIGEVVHVESRSSGKLPEEGSLSPWDKGGGLKDDSYPMSSSTDLVSSSVIWHLPNGFVHESGFEDGLESFRSHIYLTNIARDLLQYQLDEQNELNNEFCNHSSAELSKLRVLVQETQKSNAVVNEELAQCRSELQAATAAKEEFEMRLLFRKEELETLNNNFLELQSNLEVSQQELVHLLAELAACRDSLEMLQKEKENLTTSLTLETDARKKIEEENEFLLSENAKLASELLEPNKRLCIALDKQNLLECNIRDTGLYLEQLAEDNLCLSSSLALHKAKLKELEDEYFRSHLPNQEAESQDNDYHAEGTAPVDAAEDLQSTKGATGASRRWPLLQKVNDDQSDGSSILGVLKGHLQDAKSIVQNLEKWIQGMHSHSASLSRSDGRAGASGVSKLVDDFESKTNLAEIAPEDEHMSTGEQPDDSYAITKEQTTHLRDTIEQIELEIGKVDVHMVEVWNSRISKNLQMESQALKQKSDGLQANIDELVEKMSKYGCTIEHLQTLFDEIEKDTHNQTGTFFSQVELLQNEMNGMFSILKQERDSLTDVIFGAAEKLNQYTALQIYDNCDIGSYLMASADAATKLFESLHEKLDTANLNYDTLRDSYNEQYKQLTSVLGRNEFATGLMQKMYVSLCELLYDTHQRIGTLDLDMKAEEILQHLPEHYEMLIMHLHELLDERILFLSKTNELESYLLHRNEEIQDLNKRCNALEKNLDDLQCVKCELESILMKKDEVFEEAKQKCLALTCKLDYHGSNKDVYAPSTLFECDKVTLMSDSLNNDFFRSLLLLESLVGFHIQEYEGTIEQINLSKKCLLEVDIFPEISDDSWSLPLPTLLKEEFLSRLNELQGQLDSLCMSDLKHEIELQIFKEHWSRTKDALEASHLELHLKVSELEQSEQRLFSVREKLSIAVSKGKGLIVQRDGLKQSLMEKSSDLEKCLNELQLKEASLQEVEAKLKSYSEVDRIEALESELSYIRNSATALRDSFLLKDSVLQRIEEVLEELDFPEHFHSKDIVEKIELLSKMVSGNSSFTMTDWDKKCSVGVSQSDAVFVVTDSWRDDSQAISKPGFDELKNKYEHLERKVYDLAEHNDMLEQSLFDRNSLVQKWEEVLDKIEIPPQLSTLEPEDKIKWLGNTISEVQQERDALQMKIKNLEGSSNMLTVDLEESHKNLSELNAKVMAVKSENNFLAESLNKLKFENLGLSDKVVQHDTDRTNFQKEIDCLQEKLAEKDRENKDFHEMENEIWRLLDLIGNAFHDFDLSESLTDGSATKRLEGLLRKLVDEYTILVAEKTMPKEAVELASEETNLSTGKGASGDVPHDIEHELSNMRLQLDKATSNLDLVKEERDEAVERCHTLMLEKEATNRHQKSLQEEMAAEMEKNKSLLSQLEVMCKENDALCEQLTQEEEKSASTREKLNIAVRKGKGLVQQRDSLKQEIEEMNNAIAQLKSENNQRVEALESEKKDLVNRLVETEQNLKYSNQTLSKLLKALDGIDVVTKINNTDPVQKLEEIGKVNHDLHSALVSAEQEAKKSKRAAELLLAELNEVQERADILQEELGQAETMFLESSKQKDAAESAKVDALHRLEEIILLHSEERKKQINNLVELNSGIGQIKKVCFEFSGLLANAFTRDVDLLSYMEIYMESIVKQITHNDLPYRNPFHEENLNSIQALQELKMNKQSEDYSIAENLAFAVQCLLECLSECNDLKRKFHKHSSSIDQQASRLLKTMESVNKKFSSQKEESESLKRDVTKLESTIRDKENEICAVTRNLSLLYQACSNLITEIENGNSQETENKLAVEGQSVTKAGKSPSEIDGQGCVPGSTTSLTYDCIRSLADKLLLIVMGARNNETAELRATILELQREVQEKDVHTSKIAAELVSQMRDAEAVAKRSLAELDSAKMTICSLEKQIEAMEADKKLLELRVVELKDLEASSNELQGRIKSLSDSLTAKEQEIEVLMEALDEEEAQVEDLENRNKELKNIVDEKNLNLKNLEASHEKSLAKLSTTVNKFDELYNLSEGLLAEVENLQSQLQGQESEISFLRQEVTRCTNELLASEESHKKHSSEINEQLKWFDMTVSRFGLTDVHMNGEESQIRAYTDILDKSIASVMAELDDLRIKVSQPARRTLPGPSEVEPIKTESASGGIVTHVRSGRKFNSDQIAIAIDTEKDDTVIDDEDDDKSHGFKSLTMSRFIPRVSRPIADKIDGMWVSGDRLLMRQPTLRLGVLIYWVALHALLASLI